MNETPTLSPFPVLIVEARFYPDIADQLLAGATDYLKAQNIAYEIVSVPGAFEIPAAVAMAFDSHPHQFGGVIALACVIRGETSHYDYVCAESARGLNEMAMRHALPLGYGILTTENYEQATARADTKKINKGAKAAEACVTMMRLKETL